MARRSIRKRRHLSGGSGWSNYFHHVFTEEDSQAPDFEEKIALKRESVERMGWVFSWSVGPRISWEGVQFQTIRLIPS